MTGETIFRALLLAYPRDFRDRFGDEMLEFYRERRREQLAADRSAARFWTHLVIDVMVSAPGIRLRSRDATPADLPWFVPNYPPDARLMDTVSQDIRYAARALIRRPGFALVAALTLALGIGATTAIYSVADAVLIQPLPWPQPDRLVSIGMTRDGQPQQGVVFLDVLDWRAGTRAFDLLGVFRPQSVSLTGGTVPERLTGTFVNAAGLRLLGATTEHGRIFADAETDVPSQPVALLTNGFWRSHYAASADAIGKPIVINGQTLTIVGVLRGGFQGPFGATDVWLPIGYYPNKGDLTTRGRQGVAVVGRMTAGVSMAQAERDLGAVAAQLAQKYPATNAGMGVSVTDLKQSVVGQSRIQVYLIFGAVLVVLLVACANVANLQLARAASRRHELSVRSALGAGRSRLVRHLVTESLLLAVAGGMIGLAIASAGVRWLGNTVPGFLQFYGTIALNRTVLLFAAAITVGTGFVFALPPALRSSRVRLTDALTMRGADGARLFGRGSALVFAQTSLCVVLLVTAGLLGRSLIALSRVDPGFDPDHVLTLQFRLPVTRYDRDAKIEAMLTRSLTELRAIPGVQSAALVRATPLNGNIETFPYQLEGAGAVDPKKLPMLQLNLVSPGYYRTMEIPLIAGRDFSTTDRTGTAPVAIVNQQLADKIAPDGSALGKRIQLPDGAEMKWFDVIGVVGNVKHRSVGEAQLDQAYLPYTQRPLIFTEAVVRTAGDPAALGRSVREAIWRVDPDQPVWGVRALTSSIGNALGGRIFVLRLLAGFALLAVLLALIGIYGVMSYSVAGRTQEMGIRMALGAGPKDVVGMVVRQGMHVIAAAIVVGLMMAAGATRFLQSELFGVRSTDPSVFIAVPLALALVAAVACYLPARRASKVDPVVTLRSD